MKPLLLTPHEMERVTGGRWRHLPDRGLEISGINFYRPYVTQGDLFAYIPRKEATPEDACATITRAFRHGAVAVLAPKAVGARSLGLPILEVTDTNKALQDLALAASLKYDGTRVLVTGSHGKTGFKNQLHHLIRKQIPTHAYLGSANKEIPVMRALAALPQGADVAIIEVAVPRKDVGRDRTFFVRPNYCIITGIGPEHLRSHGSMENLVHNKAEVVAGLRPGGCCLLNGDDAEFSQLQQAVRDLSACPIHIFGSGRSCDGRLVAAEFGDFRWHVRAEILGESVEYDLPLLERYAPLASVAVLLQAKLLGVDVAACVGEYADYHHFESSGNLYRVPFGADDFLVYDQSTRAELKGFESMFELMSRLHPAHGGRKIVVMSEFFDIADNPGLAVDVPRMRKLMEQAGIDILYTINDFMQHREALPPGLDWRLHGATPADIRDDLLATVQANDMVFLRADPPANLGALVKELLRLGKGAARIIY